MRILLAGILGETFHTGICTVSSASTATYMLIEIVDFLLVGVIAALLLRKRGTAV